MEGRIPHRGTTHLAIVIPLLLCLAGCSCDQITGPVCDGVPASGIGYWNGSRWSTMEGVISGYVTMFADTLPDRVLVSDRFTMPGERGFVERIGFWSETENRWEFLGGEISGSIVAIVRHGDDIIVGGDFQQLQNADSSIVPANSLARWNGERWEAIPGVHRGVIHMMRIAGDQLIVEGDFDADPAPVRNLGILDLLTGQWSSPGTPNNSIYAMAVEYPWLFICGSFELIDAMPAPFFARYNLIDRRWSSSSTLPNYSNARELFALSEAAVHNGKVYISGKVSNTYPWERTYAVSIADDTWQEILEAPDNIRVIYSNGRHLYFGGSFSRAGNTPAKNIVRYDDATGVFTPVGFGTCASREESGVVYSQVDQMATTRSGFYVAGKFSVLSP